MIKLFWCADPGQFIASQHEMRFNDSVWCAVVGLDASIGENMNKLTILVFLFFLSLEVVALAQERPSMPRSVERVITRPVGTSSDSTIPIYGKPGRSFEEGALSASERSYQRRATELEQQNRELREQIVLLTKKTQLLTKRIEALEHSK